MAHSLPTSYRSFIDHFWKNIEENYKEGKHKHIVYIDDSYLHRKPIGHDKVNNFNDFTHNVNNFSKKINTRYRSVDNNFMAKRKGHPESGYISVFNFKNKFFKIINTQNSMQNWVDIENEYYKLLKECLKESDNTAIKRLNEEFTEVKKLLEQYLVNEVDCLSSFSDEKTTAFLNIFNENSYKGKNLVRFCKEMSIKR